MKKILGLILAFFCFFEIFAGDGLVFRDSPFEISAKTDGALLSAGVLLSGGDLILDNLLKVNRKTFDEDKNFDKSSVNAFDRFFMQDYNAALNKIGGNAFLCSALAMPASVFCAVEKSEWKTVALMYAETLLIANGLKEFTKLAVTRYRPMCYFETGDSFSKYKDDGDFANSFISGHSTMAFAGASFAGYVFSEYFPDSPWRYAVYAGGFSLAAATAAVRVMSGNHFVSDVAAGAAVGALTGFLVPRLHLRKNSVSDGGSAGGSVAGSSGSGGSVGKKADRKGQGSFFILPCGFFARVDF